MVCLFMFTAHYYLIKKEKRKMALLNIGNVKKVFGDEVIIIEDVSFEVQKNDRIGLVGINGSGKTTLFRILTGEYEPDDGFVNIVKGTQLGYMEQHVVKDLDRTAYEEVLTVFRPLMDMEAEIEKTNDMLSVSLPEDMMNKLVQKQAELNERFVDDGGLTYKSRVRSALMGLGFTAEQIESPVGVLSGGQKAKLQLAKMLLSGANLLLLDEPTNHLDIDAVEWLENFLLSYNGAYIVISHDRYFLDKVTNRTFEIENTHLYAYKGNYSKFLVQKEERRLSMGRDYAQKSKEIKRIEGIIEQQKRWNQARNYVTIASKQKQIERIRRDMQEPEKDPANIKFRFKACSRSGDEVLLADDISLSFDKTQIFEHANLDIKRGEKVFLIGPNGCGKTSFFKILLNEYKASSGFFKFGVGVDIGYYEQSQSGLNDSRDVIDEIWDMYPRMTMTEVRSALAVFLFKGEDVFKMVGDLSGGERARVLLLKLMLSDANFLLLDEPTNHLDIGSREALENALSDYDGTLFVVSHDRYLINKLADKIYYLDEHGTKLYEGNYDSFAEQRELEQSKAEENEVVAKKPVESPYKKKKERDAELRRLRAALGKLETENEEIEEKVMQLEIELNDPENVSDYSAAMSITKEIDELNARAEDIMNEWTETSLTLDEVLSIAEVEMGG